MWGSSKEVSARKTLFLLLRLHCTNTNKILRELFSVEIDQWWPWTEIWLTWAGCNNLDHVVTFQVEILHLSPSLSPSLCIEDNVLCNLYQVKVSDCNTTPTSDPTYNSYIYTKWTHYYHLPYSKEARGLLQLENNLKIIFIWDNR